MSVPARAATRHIASSGTQLPHRCGIAICTTDLAAALVGADPATAYDVLAVNDTAGGHAYPPHGTATLAQHDRGAYRRAAPSR